MADGENDRYKNIYEKNKHTKWDVERYSGKLAENENKINVQFNRETLIILNGPSLKF